LTINFKKSSLNIFIFSLFLSIPFFEFYEKNFNDLNLKLSLTLVFIYTIFFVIGLLITFILTFFKFRNFYNNFFFYIVSFFIFFKWYDLTIFFKKYFINYVGHISLLFVFVTIIIFFNLIILKNKKIVKIFFFNFFIIYFIFLSFNILIQSLKIDNLQENFINKKDTQLLSKIEDKKNIYYVILDGAMSPDRFELIYNEKNVLKNSNIDLKNYRNFESVHSSYFDTHLTIGSIFNLNYVSNIFKEYNSNNLYPKNLQRSNLKHFTPSLIKILNDNNYKFIWYSNSIINCKNINESLCGFENKWKATSWINKNVLAKFLSRSPLVATTNKINPMILLDFYHQENDAIYKFLNNSDFYKNQKQLFFFIHSIMPHSPFVYDSECKIVDNEKSKTVGYNMNYKCALKRIGELQNYISRNDKNSVLVLQGDHGTFFKDKEYYELGKNRSKYKIELFEKNKKELLDNYKILNIIKNNSCDFPQNKLDNVNSIIFALNCALNLKINYINKKTFYNFKTRLE
jgi:hypothetical protein